jgi:uncharacterized membrane protein
MGRITFKGWAEYLKDNPEGYWFKRKLYGWGWTPATRRGWMVTTGFAVAVFALAVRVDESASEEEVLKLVVLPIFALVAAFILIAYKTGEKPKWTWGLPQDDVETHTEKPKV